MPDRHTRRQRPVAIVPPKAIVDDIAKTAARQNIVPVAVRELRAATPVFVKLDLLSRKRKETEGRRKVSGQTLNRLRFTRLG